VQRTKAISQKYPNSQALENVHVVISEWIETAKLFGRDIPEPKGKLAYA
jgi:predicted RNase H-like HicB family nuclease